MGNAGTKTEGVFQKPWFLNSGSCTNSQTNIYCVVPCNGTLLGGLKS